MDNMEKYDNFFKLELNSSSFPILFQTRSGKTVRSVLTKIIHGKPYRVRKLIFHLCVTCLVVVVVVLFCFVFFFWGGGGDGLGKIYSSPRLLTANPAILESVSQCLTLTWPNVDSCDVVQT